MSVSAVERGFSRLQATRRATHFLVPAQCAEDACDFVSMEPIDLLESRLVVVLVADRSNTERHQIVSASISSYSSCATFAGRRSKGLVRALGGTVSEGRGTRVRFQLGERVATVHGPHPKRVAGKATPEDVRRFLESVEDYLELCAEIGKDPEKPYRGEFLVRPRRSTGLRPRKPRPKG
jgi:hypothetical protein